MTTEHPPRGAAAASLVLAPRAIAVVGVSADAGTPGRNLLANLEASAFRGVLHVVSRHAREIDGRACVAAIDDLPSGVDLAVLAIPAAAVREAVASCVRRQVGAAVVFASGFAEASDAGRAEQAAISADAAAGGLALVGPNCLGFSNHVAGFGIGFAPGRHVPPPLVTGRGAVAIVAQSGAMMAHLGLACAARNLPIGYAISTGNEAGLGVEDFIDYLADDAATAVIALFAEHIRRPPDFLAAVRRARRAGKSIVLLHPGRSVRAREAARSHTGALVGNYRVMRTLAGAAGVVLVDTLAELVDVAELLARFPDRPVHGVGVVTSSGAFCGIALDYCDTLGLDVPVLAPATEARLRAILPPFAAPHNPLDLTTQPMREPALLGHGAAALLDDPAIGSVVVAITPGAPGQSVRYLNGLLPAISDPAKPVVLAIMGDGSPLPDEFMALIREHRIVLSRSPERSLAAVARVTGDKPRPAQAVVPLRLAGPVPAGTVPEYRAKALLAEAGIAVPEGGLAGTVAEAASLAQRIGYPVALKAQAADLAHKSDAGGVVLGISDAAALDAAWHRLVERVSAAHPDLALDGVLVERMAPPGVELVVGAKREPGWGPVLMIGMGGIWVETLHDVVLLPPDLDEAAIEAAILQLKGAPLLRGARGQPPCDVGAVAGIAARLGRLVLSHPEILEVEINPLTVHATGATALDALIVGSTI